MRYLVERSRDAFEDVGAEDIEFLNSGGLAFFNGDEFVIAYAPGQWITVVPEAE